jgi:mannan endo-1,4-beta-mannosidase
MCFFALLAIAFCLQAAAAQSGQNDEFVRRSGSKLVLAEKEFRYSGPNIEWLGLEAYGPHDPAGPRYPSHFEVDDVLDTAKEMGARVVRSQTLGDSVNCDLCIEPRPGVFNPNAFASVDYAIKAAHDRGLRLIVTLGGDCADCELSGPGQYLLWKGTRDIKRFFADPEVIASFEAHIAAVLNHKNALTGIAYKDDPTILAWENCNLCGIGLVWTARGLNLDPYWPWIDTIGHFIKSIDPHHLYLDNSGFFAYAPNALNAETPDIVTSEYYPHWDFKSGGHTTWEKFAQHADLVTSHGKVYVVNEYGWDPTNWNSREEFKALLQGWENNSKISGDSYWALLGHNERFGWQPIPGDVHDPAVAVKAESGHWWALYYGGNKTLAVTAEEMRARAETLRIHAYAMAGIPVPPRAVPPPPVVTFKDWGLIGWRGSAGAAVYSIQKKLDDASSWETICDKCATDADTPWPDTKPVKPFVTKYRVIAYNADGVPSASSNER